jgi:DNA-binding XRE family transcriptional regulator
MGESRPVRGALPGAARRLRLRRGRPRSFAEWNALQRWGRLPEWEIAVPGFLLRLARTEAGLSQRALAERLGVTQQAVSQAELWSSNPTVEFMRRWAEACGRSLELRMFNL